MENFKRVVFGCIFCVLSLLVFSVNFCHANSVDDLSKIKCRDFLFIHKKIDCVIYYQPAPHFIYENCQVEIKFLTDDVIRALDRFIEEDNNKWDKELQKKIRSSNTFEYNFDDFSNREQYVLRRIFAELLESGEFVLRDKESNKYIMTIRVGYYGMVTGIMGGQRGRLFFLPSGLIFFQIIDIVN